MSHRSSTGGMRVAVALGVIVALATLLLAACSSSDDKGGSTATAKAGDQTVAPTNGANNATDPASQLEALSGDWGNATAKIAYEYTVTNAGTTNTSKVTTYSRPPDSRTDFTDSDTGEATIFLTSGGKSYICTGQSCATSPAGAVNPIATVTQFAAPSAITAQLAQLAGANVDTSQQTVAGKSADCFSVKEDITNTKITWCFSSDGLLLLSSTETSGNKIELKATDAQTNVSDADFQPPYPVTDIGNYGQ